MPWFIKTERFTAKAASLSADKRKQYIDQHCCWVDKLNKSGIAICSGYLVDKNHSPGGGGLLILEADSYVIAKSIIENDPIIISGLVNWELNEWVSVTGQPIVNFNVG